MHFTFTTLPLFSSFQLPPTYYLLLTLCLPPPLSSSFFFFYNLLSQTVRRIYTWVWATHCSMANGLGTTPQKKAPSPSPAVAEVMSLSPGALSAEAHYRLWGLGGKSSSLPASLFPFMMGTASEHWLQVPTILDSRQKKASYAGHWNISISF